MNDLNGVLIVTICAIVVALWELENWIMIKNKQQ